MLNFELEKLQMDFGDTPIENIFLNEYMPSADGNFVKVYLMGYQMAVLGKSGENDYSHRTIASRLGILESDVHRAWDYWEQEGIIEKKYNPDETYSVVFLSLKELYTRNIYANEETENQTNQFIDVLENPEIAHLFTMVNFYMRREVPYQKKLDIANWIQVYNMPPTLIEEAFKYGTEHKGKRNLAYIEGIVRNWADENIRTKEALENNFKEHDRRYYRYNQVLRTMGLQKEGYVEEDVNRVNHWIDSWGFSMEMVEEAARRTARTERPNLNYLEAILRNWLEKGIDSLDKIGEDVRPTVSGRTRRPPMSDSRTEKYSARDLEKMAQKKRRSFREKRGGER